jgi:hypothetical protein
MVAMDSTGWCVLGCWLSIREGAIFATVAHRQWRNAQQVRSMAMDGCRAARLVLGIAWTFARRKCDT